MAKFQRPGRIPTDEQAAVIAAAASGETLKVLALAGTGKTTTLSDVARELEVPSLYLAFNKSIAVEAQEKFPAHVTVKTGHGLAYRPVGQALQRLGRLETNTFGIRSAMMDRFGPGIRDIGGEDASGRSAYAVWEAVTNFMNSASPRVTALHVPDEYDDLPTGKIAGVAQRVFDAMTNTNARETFPATHDAYLKAWALTKPQLPFAVIYGDEWQDANPVLRNVVEAQTHAQRIYVGDASQSIYGFRGAVNALAALDKLPAYPLTQSFRFGPAIADVANEILEAKGDPLRVKGLPSIKASIGSAPIPNVILARTNAGLFGEAVNMLDRLDPGEKLAFVGGVKPVIDMVTGAYELYAYGKTQNRDFRFFKTWSDLAGAVEEGKAKEFAPFARLVEQRGSEIPELCRALVDGSADESKARVVLSTAHKFKGREAESVRIAGDFREFCALDETTNKFKLDVEEANLAYVTVTRAKSLLDESAYRSILEASKENIRTMQAELVLPAVRAGTTPTVVATKERPVLAAVLPPVVRGYIDKVWDKIRGGGVGEDRLGADRSQTQSESTTREQSPTAQPTTHSSTTAPGRNKLARIEDFLDRLAEIGPSPASASPASTPPAYEDRVWSIALNELKYLKTATRPIPAELAANDPVPERYATTTLRGVLSDYRAAIRADERFGPKHVVLDHLRPSNADQSHVRTDYREKLLESTTASGRRTIDSDRMIDTALALLDVPYSGHGVPVQAAALMLLTGRRAIELVRGDLEVSPNASNFPDRAVLRFTGQAHVKDAPSYDIPVLADPQRILAAYTQLRRDYPVLAKVQEQLPGVPDRELNVAINAKVANGLGSAAKSHFEDEAGVPLRPMDLRKAYAVIAYERYAGLDGVSLAPQDAKPYNAHVASILGHNELNFESALGYQRLTTVGRENALAVAFAEGNGFSAAVARRGADAARQSGAERDAQYLNEIAQLFLAANEIRLPESARQGIPLEGAEARSDVVSLVKGDKKTMAADDLQQHSSPVSESNRLEDRSEVETPAQQTAAPAAEGRDPAARNAVNLVGTLRDLKPAQGNRPATFGVEVKSGEYTNVIPVAGFRDAAQSVGALANGTRIEVEGYLSTRPVVKDEQTRHISSVTASAVNEVGPELADRNSVFLRGNTGKDPHFKENEKGGFAAVSLAVGKDKAENVLFADLVAFGQRAQAVQANIGQGDLIAVDGKANLVPGKDGFPPSIQVIVHDAEVERKKEPKLELTGHIVREDAQVREGPSKARVSFRMDTGREGDDRYQNVITYADKGATWPSGLQTGTNVAVVGKQAVETYEKDGIERQFNYIKASSITVVPREQMQAVEHAVEHVAPAAVPALDADDLADQARAAIAVQQVPADAVAPTVEKEIDANDLADDARSFIAEATALLNKPTAEQALIDLAELPVFTARSTDVVVERESMKSGVAVSGPVVGRSEDGESFYIKQGRAYVETSRDALSEAPRIGDQVTISRDAAGKDRAKSVDNELELTR